MENYQNFKGWRKPSTDFIGSQNQLQTELVTVEVDLSTARTFGSLATPPIVVPVAGNSFFIDQNTDVGNAVVVFNDKAVGGNLQSLSPGVYLQPGSIVKVNANQLIVANAAQAGKKLRIHYGVDVDFVPALALTGTSNVNITNTSIATTLDASGYGASYKSNTNMLANTPEQVFSAASNVNGAKIWIADYTSSGAGQGINSFVAKATAPASPIDGVVLACGPAGPQQTMGAKLGRAITLPAGLGLYRVPSQADIVCIACCLYTLL